MRITVKTRQNVRIHLDLSKVTSQTEVLTDDGPHYLIHSEGGKTVDLTSALPDVETKIKDLRTIPVTFLDKLSRH